MMENPFILFETIIKEVKEFTIPWLPSVVQG